MRLNKTKVFLNKMKWSIYLRLAWLGLVQKWLRLVDLFIRFWSIKLMTFIISDQCYQWWMWHLVAVVRWHDAETRVHCSWSGTWSHQWSHWWSQWPHPLPRLCSTTILWISLRQPSLWTATFQNGELGKNIIKSSLWLVVEWWILNIWPILLFCFNSKVQLQIR